MTMTESALVVISVVLLAILNIASAIAIILLAIQNMRLKLKISRSEPNSKYSTSNNDN